MSSTRYAAADAPFSPERYASSEAYRSPLGALLVAKRCALLQHDRETRELIWFLQDHALPDPWCAGGRLGSIESVAAALLDHAGFIPPQKEILVEDLDLVRGRGISYTVSAPAHAIDSCRASTVTQLARALCDLALAPQPPPAAMPGLDREWRQVITSYREECRNQIVRGLAPTSVAKRTAQALGFTRDTCKPSLSVGVSRLGKSAATKAFCAASAGLARYVLTPEDNDMVSLYRAVAKAIGVADSPSKKASDVRDLIERALFQSRLMLVFDEAHNLFSGAKRITKQPQRILWIRRLIDGRVPIAFVALPEFSTRIARHADEKQLGWDAAQIVELIAKVEVLPGELTPADFKVLVGRLAPELADSDKANIAAAANSQRGAQYVIDVLEVARQSAKKAGREIPDSSDVSAAIGNRPHFTAAGFIQSKAPETAPIGESPGTTRQQPDPRHSAPAPEQVRTAHETRRGADGGRLGIPNISRLGSLANES